MKYQLPASSLPPPIHHRPPGLTCCTEDLTVDQIYTEFLRFYQKYGDLDTQAFRDVVFREVREAIIQYNDQIDLPLCVTMLTEW